MAPRLARITIFPIKSLDGVDLSSAQLTARAGLAHDRRFAMRDAEGKFVNGKRTSAIHPLAAQFDPTIETVTLGRRGAGEGTSFHLTRDRATLERWLSDFFALPVMLDENPTAGFPDDLDAPGPTLISTATLETVAAWFPGMTVDDARRRFRTNLEIDGVEPFWEDRLYAMAGNPVRFGLGRAVIAGTNPCQRCVVPTRSPTDGDIWSGFQKTFAQRRQATLPAWAEPSRFNHYYRLAVNTQVIEAPAPICVGDPLTL
ncbi:MAG TPA: MOSC N-terminal beta barrel domain-containing protein [Pirellulales bacterium]|jgi:hypothetical protein|nr:MOSC N-terminal beta barrel domain-containing protein [Pirellulales bacterium]